MIGRLLTVDVIPHAAHRYPTAGDWQWGEDGSLTVRVSDLGDPRYAWLIALHEIVEAVLCREHGVAEQAVDAWDIAHPGDEPGADPAAPYHGEHVMAGLIEETVAGFLGVDGEAYLAAFP